MADSAELGRGLVSCSTPVSDERRCSIIFSSSRFDHITPLLHQLHWLKASEWIAVKCAVLVYKCLHGSASSYLVDELCQVADVEVRQRLRCLVFVTDRRPHSTIHRRGPNLSSCHCWYLEQFTPSTSLLHPRCLSSGHTSRLISSPFLISIPDRVQCLRSETCHFGDTLVVHFGDTLVVHITYLLICGIADITVDHT